MDNTSLISQTLIGLPEAYTFNEAKTLKQEVVWKNLATITVGQAIAEWLSTLGRLTAKNYASGMKQAIGGQIDQSRVILASICGDQS